MSRLTTEEFIEKARKVHGGKYDYSKVDYKDSHTKVCIICPEHGEFWQIPYSHLKGCKCPKCAGKNITTEEFIEKARKVHENKYDYSKTEYKNWLTPVCIICPEHGEFWQSPNNHLSGCGCLKCSLVRRSISQTSNKDEFIEKACKVHENKYDYSKVKYVDAKTKVCIICPEHGEFWQTPNSHLGGKGCPVCSGNKPLTTEEFIEKARQVHNNKYDYSKVDYKGTNFKVCIICPEHGEFWQTPSSHLKGSECPKCAHRSFKYSVEEFVQEARKIHGTKYDYSKVNYKDAHTKVCIICPEHGAFWQIPTNHLRGKGCPICNFSSLERKCKQLLESNNISYEPQKHFDWLGKQSLDFYLPEQNIAIECQGEQHFGLVDFFGGTLQERRELDIKKKNICQHHDIKILYLANQIKPEYYQFELYSKDNLFESASDIIAKIKSED